MNPSFPNFSAGAIPCAAMVSGGFLVPPCKLIHLFLTCPPPFPLPPSLVEIHRGPSGSAGKQGKKHMTSAKQIAANEANAQKSTGPKTAAGKAVVAGNAISHGILSGRLFLDGENPAEFDALVKDLMQALRPMGALEMALAEKVAVALWKQRRLVAAETAMLEMGRHMRLAGNREEVKAAAGMGYTDADVTEADLIPMDDEDRQRMAFCLDVLQQFELVSDEAMGEDNLAALSEVAPAIYRQLLDEAEEDEQSIEDYLKEASDDGLAGWVYALRDWCGMTIRQLQRRPLVQSIAKLVQAQKSTPMGNEVLMRYQVALDGELYRAMDALRKQQAFRLKLGIEIDGSAEIVG